MACPFATELECQCFFGLATSGLSASDPASYVGIMDENTVQRYHLTGEWIGIDAITEYMSFWGGDFDQGLGDVPGFERVFDFSYSTSTQECIGLVTATSRVKTRTAYSVDGKEYCVDFAAANIFNYSLTGMDSPSINIHEWTVWTPDDLMPVLFGSVDSPATAESMCETIAGSCADYTAPNQLQPEEIEEPLSMEDCLDRFANLPPNHQDYWIDGDSSQCRILHGSYARNNSDHCPHISFPKQIDVSGKFKCYESKYTQATDLLLPGMIEFFEQAARLPYNTTNPLFAAYSDGACTDLLPPLPFKDKPTEAPTGVPNSAAAARMPHGWLGITVALTLVAPFLH